ncbi:acyltransferase family protein [Pseudomonas koreensis]|uniref:acyltransferase family protein n=1 Tax=Pseudomonas koreensis TaxID=198620 RepID=UPI002077752D|nr:acyltransferase family protein [Pseudomonas koreensis]MCM8743631.1 acyltransferase [Pseudomonas koreensis]
MTSLAETVTTTKTPHLTHPKYRPDIDGLRAIAVLSVVLFHAFPRWLPGGFIGVDIFFIISGYLISTIIYGSLERQAFSFTEFYARRIKRIFPALLLVLTSCYAFGWFTLFADEFQQLGKHIAGGSAFISNFVLWDESGYFDTTAEIKPLLHLWSLGIEEQFYIIWPLILWAAWKVRVNVLVLTLAFLVGSFVLNMVNIDSNPSLTFYWPHTRAWELLSGSVLAYATTHGALSKAGAAVRNAMSAIGVALLAIGFAIVTNTGFPGWQAIIPCAGAILIISAGPQAAINKWLLSSKPFVWLGLISFPLYLWHWPLLTFPRIINSAETPMEVRATAVILSVILALATYRLVELPLRRINWKFKTAALCTIMLAVGITGYVTYTKGGITSRANVEAVKNINEQMVSTTGWKYAKNETCMNRYPFEDAKDYFWWFCVTNKNESPTIVILGTSFANHLYPGIVNAFPNETTLSIGVCDPTFTNLPQYPVNPCSSDRPIKQTQFIDSIIKKSGTVKTVIIDGLYTFPSEEYLESLKNRISYMETMGIKVVLFVPHLMLNYNIRGCFARPLKTPEKDCSISDEMHKANLNGFSSRVAELQAKMPNLYVFDQNEAFCNSKGCSMITDDLPVFRDEYYHYSEYASKKVGERFKEWAKENNLGL